MSNLAQVTDLIDSENSNIFPIRYHSLAEGEVNPLKRRIQVPFARKGLWDYQHYDGEWYLCDNATGGNAYIGPIRFQVVKEEVDAEGCRLVTLLFDSEPEDLNVS